MFKKKKMIIKIELETHLAAMLFQRIRYIFLFVSSSFIFFLNLCGLSQFYFFFSCLFLSLNIHSFMLLQFLLFFLIKEYFSNLKFITHQTSIDFFFLVVFIVFETWVSNFTSWFFFSCRVYCFFNHPSLFQTLAF